MGLRLSTEKPLKGSKNIFKGQESEKLFSAFIHQKYTPLLVSSLILREQGAGQIDLCVLTAKEVIIFEIKTSGHLSRGQYQRLKDASTLMSALFQRSASLRIIGPEELVIAKSAKLH